MNKTLLSAFVGLGVLTAGGAYLAIKKHYQKEETLEDFAEVIEEELSWKDTLKDDVEVIEEAI